MAIQKKQTTTSKRWPRYCLIAAVVMVAIAAVLYFWVYYQIDSEFSSVSSYYGSRYEELFKLSAPDGEVKDQILQQAEEAFAFVGGESDCAAFGALSRYCTDDPAAAKTEFTLEHLAGKTGDTEGYLWIAYTHSVYDADGALLSSSGSEEQRILSRWTVEKTDAGWKVTEILEHP